MSAVDMPLMAGSRETLLRPGPKFHRLPIPERRRLASTFLDLFQRLKAAYRVEPPFEAPVRELIAWAAAGEDIERGVQVWRQELHKAQLGAKQDLAAAGDNKYPGAGRSPANKGHGWPACSAGGPDPELPQGVKTPFMPTAVPSSKENAS